MERSTQACTQPQCVLRTEEVDARFLAELIVGVLSGKDVREGLGSETRIDSLPRCVGCVERVMAGRRPFETVEMLRRIEAAGHTSWRRARRRRVGALDR